MTHLTLGTATLPQELKNSNFCRYLADMEENANKLHFKCTDFNSSMRITVFWLYLCVFYQNLVFIAEYHVDCWQTLHDVCCDEFPVLQIDRKSKQVKEQWHGQFYLQSVRRTTHYFKNRKYQNSWMVNNVRGGKYAICLHFLTHLLNTCRKFEFLIFQGSAATCLWWGG